MPRVLVPSRIRDNLASSGGGTGNVTLLDAVRVATISPGTLATDFEAGDTIDGVTLAAGDRILIKDQVTGSENGIYIVNPAGAPTRASDMNTGAAASGNTVFASEGNTNEGVGWIVSNDSGDDVVGTDDLVFSQTATTLPTTNVSLISSVRVATTTAGTLATDFEAGDTIDGVVLVAGNEILIKDQASGVENGVYVVNVAGAPTRSSNMPTGIGASGITVFATEGDVGEGVGWIVSNDSGSDIVGTDALIFANTATSENEKLIIFDETSTVPIPATPGTGRIWVRDDTPNVLIFTDDTGADTVLSGGGAVQTLSSVLSTGNTTGNNSITLTGTGTITSSGTTSSSLMINGGTGEAVDLLGGAATAIIAPGNVGIEGGSGSTGVGTGTGGAVNIDGGTAGSGGTPTGGFVNITGGNGLGNGDGGNVVIAGGASTTTDGGDITITGGSGSVTDGSITISTLNAAGTPGDINFSARGSTTVTFNDSSDVNLNTTSQSIVGAINESLVTNRNISYALVSLEVIANSATFTDIAYFPWLNSRFSGYSSGTVVFEATIVDYEAEVRLFDTAGAAALGTGATVGSGFYSFAVSNPGGNSRLRIQVRRTGVGSTNPRIFGVLLEYAQ